MPSNAIDSLIYRDMYGTDELRAVFTDEPWCSAGSTTKPPWRGPKPQSVSCQPRLRPRSPAKARVENIDFAALRQGIYDTTHELVPLIWQLAALCDGDAGG